MTTYAYIVTTAHLVIGIIGYVLWCRLPNSMHMLEADSRMTEEETREFNERKRILRTMKLYLVPIGFALFLVNCIVAVYRIAPELPQIALFWSVAAIAVTSIVAIFCVYASFEESDLLKVLDDKRKSRQLPPERPMATVVYLSDHRGNN